jgi:hypothetical protein
MCLCDSRELCQPIVAVRSSSCFVQVVFDSRGLVLAGSLDCKVAERASDNLAEGFVVHILRKKTRFLG